MTGGVEVDDIDAALVLLDRWHPPAIDTRGRLRLAAAAVRAGALRALPRAPAAELRPSGRRHSYARDRRAVRHHYDVSNEFFALFLDESMTYSCAIFSRGARTLEEAQATKLELVCTKLALSPGERVLDVGCGWGSFAIHAAREHGVHVTGITLSEPQAALARERAAAAGVADRVDIRVADYRDPLEREGFDAVASIGMVEHVGSTNIDSYARRLAAALRPGGRLLNHGIARLRHTDPEAARVLGALRVPRRRAPASVAHPGRARARGLRDTARRGLRLRLRGHAASLARAAGEPARRGGCASPARSACACGALYLRAARRGFEKRFMSIYQVLARLPG